MTTLIAPFVTAADLAELPEAVLVDVRYYLDDREGAQAYAEGHLPGARFIAMDEVLAGPASPEAGRHPLPDPAVFAAGIGAAGIGSDDTVVAYDDAGGTMASRLVWMLRALGVQAAVLDGGIGAWQGELSTEVPAFEAKQFPVRSIPEALLADMDQASDSTNLVIDSRAAERYRGEVEPIDRVAGHIPGAVNLPIDKQQSEGRLASDQTIAQNAAQIGLDGDREFIAYCGSGISATFNLLALEQAGFTKGRLYPGSWSQYSASGRPIATGNEPTTSQAVADDGADDMNGAENERAGADPLGLFATSDVTGSDTSGGTRSAPQDPQAPERAAEPSVAPANVARSEARATLWTNLVALLGGVLIALALTYIPIGNPLEVIGVLIAGGMVCLMFGQRGSALRGLGNAMLFSLGPYLFLFGMNMEKLLSQLFG